MKVSFDFDDTLDRPAVFEFAKQLVDEGFDVWITTCRLSPENAPSISWNDDLFKVVKELGVPKTNVIFTGLNPKWKHILNCNFIFHLDDDSSAIKLINKHTKYKTVGIGSRGGNDWKAKCIKAINKFKLKNQ